MRHNTGNVQRAPLPTVFTEEGPKCAVRRIKFDDEIAHNLHRLLLSHLKANQARERVFEQLGSAHPLHSRASTALEAYTAEKRERGTLRVKLVFRLQEAQERPCLHQLRHEEHWNMLCFPLPGPEHVDPLRLSKGCQTTLQPRLQLPSSRPNSQPGQQAPATGCKGGRQRFFTVLPSPPIRLWTP